MHQKTKKLIIKFMHLILKNILLAVIKSFLIVSGKFLLMEIIHLAIGRTSLKKMFFVGLMLLFSNYVD